MRLFSKGIFIFYFSCFPWVFILVTKRDLPLFLGLSFLFTTVLSDQRFSFLALTHWRVLLLCTSRCSTSISFNTWSRNILIFISWIYASRDCGSRRSTSESCERYVHGLRLFFLDLPSLLIGCEHVDIHLHWLCSFMSVEGLLGTIASIYM